MTREEALQLLLTLSEQPDETAANTICDLLGSQPLALRLACAYVREHKPELTSYLKLLLDCQAEVLSSGSVDEEYTILVAALCSVRRLWVSSPGSGMALIMLSFYAPQKIPRSFIDDFFSQLATDLRETGQPVLGSYHALELAARHELVVLTDDSVAPSHRLVQKAMRGGLPRDAQSFFLEGAMILLTARLPNEPAEEAGWPVYEQCAPHIFALAERSEFFGVGQHMAVRGLAMVGAYYLWSGNQEKAKELMLRVIKLKLALGEHQLVQDVLDSLKKIQPTDPIEKQKKAMRRAWGLLRMKAKT